MRFPLLASARARFAVLGLLAALVAVPAQAQDEELSGWLLRLEGGGRPAVALRVAHAAFALEKGEALHPAADPTAVALFETRLFLRSSGEYRLGLEVEGGGAHLELRGEDGARLALAATDASGRGTTPAVELAAGEVRLVVRFRRDRTRAARLRVTWERTYTPLGGFPSEPIPARATLLPEGALGAIAAEARAFEGRLLLQERGCTNCHAIPRAAKHAVGTRRGPVLAGDLGDGARHGLPWLTEWIRDPLAKRPWAGMPRLLDGVEDPEHEALALARFVAFLNTGEDDETGWTAAGEEHVLARGRELYHTVGCVACHDALAAPAEVFGDEYASTEVPGYAPVPLDGLAGKWRVSALSAFLRDPQVLRPDGRMPSLGLTEEEADSIANYLVSELGAGAPAVVDQALMREGQELFGQRGCQACHAIGDVTRRGKAPSLDELDPARGCLDPDDTATPRHGLDAEERAAVAAALAELSVGRAAPSPLDEARRRVADLGCVACHAWDGEGGVAPELQGYFISTDERVDLGDEGRLPPDLSSVGFKLTTSWMDTVLRDGARARPYLSTRMPHFGAAADGLAELLARREGVLPNTDVAEPASSDAAVLAGRKLLAPDALNCMTCHVYADFPATGTPGPNITQFAERLRYEWYRSYQQNPQRFKPGSRMPDFGTGGVSSLRDVLDGDMARQADAMWAYFGLGEFMPPPDGVEAGGKYVLAVGDRPLVHRAFLDGVGSRGVAVGLPVGVHFAFDAATCRLSYAWQGSFLDASGSWAGRGGNTLGGQGPVVWRAPDGPPLELLDAQGAPVPDLSPRFGGYRLGADGTPTFLWRLGPVSVRERFGARVSPQVVLTRSFTFTGLGDGELRLAADPALRAAHPGAGATLEAGVFRADPSAEESTLELEVQP